MNGHETPISANRYDEYPQPPARANGGQFPIIERRNVMRKILLTLSGAAMAFAVAPVAPASAEKVKTYVCTEWRGDVCTDTKRVKYKVGHVFGPTFGYTAIGDLPAPLVTRYELGPNYRYVYRDGYIFVIDPVTYAVTRVIDTVIR